MYSSSLFITLRLLPQLLLRFFDWLFGVYSPHRRVKFQGFSAVRNVARPNFSLARALACCSCASLALVEETFHELLVFFCMGNAKNKIRYPTSQTRLIFSACDCVCVCGSGKGARATPSWFLQYFFPFITRLPALTFCCLQKEEPYNYCTAITPLPLLHLLPREL